MGEAERISIHVTQTSSRRWTRVRIARTATVRDGARNGIHKRQRIRQFFGVIRVSGLFRLSETHTDLTESISEFKKHLCVLLYKLPVPD